MSIFFVGKSVMHVQHVTIYGRKSVYITHVTHFIKNNKNTVITHTTIVSFKYPYHHSQKVLTKHQNGHCCAKSHQIKNNLAIDKRDYWNTCGAHMWGPHWGKHVCVQICKGGRVDVNSQVSMHKFTDACTHSYCLFL